MKSILDPSFRYTPSAGTDLRKTFARVRREQRNQNPVRPEPGHGLNTNVLPIKQRKAGAPAELPRVASEH
jgi:hypothetical protein